MAKRKDKNEVIVFKSEQEEIKYLQEALPAFTTELAKDAKVIGNFGDLKQFLLSRVEYISNLDLESKGIKSVETLKKAVRSWRTTFKRAFDAEVNMRFKDPQNLFKALGDEVFEQIAVAESKIDEILEKEEEKRKQLVDKTIDAIEQEFKKEFKLSDFECIRDKKFYNKTANLEDTRSSIKEQYEQEAKMRAEKQGNIELIKNACKDVSELNVELYIEQLEFKPVFEILKSIESEKLRLNSLANEESEEEEDVEEEETEEVEEQKVLSTKIIQLTYSYSSDKKALLDKVFADLKRNGITVIMIR